MSISESCLRNWIAQADTDDHGSSSRLTTDEKRELAQLHREKRRLEVENEILKRVAAYFARENARVSQFCRSLSVVVTRR
jgi:transposase-like protein